MKKTKKRVPTETEILQIVLEKQKCPACKRRLRFGTLEKACIYCRGMYFFSGRLHVDGKFPVHPRRVDGDEWDYAELMG